MSRRAFVPSTLLAALLALAWLPAPAIVFAQDLDTAQGDIDGGFDRTNMPRGFADTGVRRSVYIVRHDISVEITDQVAKTTVTEVFRNPTNRVREATFRFYLPEGTAVDGFEMIVNGEPTQGKLLDANEARGIYEGIVRRDMDPGLLQFVGRQMFEARVYPVVANGDTTITIRYTQTLTAEAGLMRYRYPLNTSKYSPTEVESMTLTTRITTTQPLRMVYSPSHTVSVERIDTHRAAAVFSGTNVVSDRDFMLFWATGGDAVDLSMLNWRESADTDGYFMLSLSPQTIAADAEVQPKDFVMVLDTSGSMIAQDKLKAACNAVTYTLNRLNPRDRFAILAYDNYVNAFDDGKLQAASPDAVKRALAFVGKLVASGGTNIEAALTAAIAALPEASSNRASMIVFLTDGQPTVGNVNVEKLVQIGALAAAHGTRIFTFGVGVDVNTHLLDRIADTTGGARCYVEPGEELEVTVSAFYNKVASPVLTNLTLRAIGGQLVDIYPQTLPDLFVGSNVVLFGRWRGARAPQVELVGTCGDRSLRFVSAAPDAEVGDAADESANAFIARLWAMRKVGFLLDAMRLNQNAAGERELKESIAALGTRYGIVTPYNSFLVVEPDSDTPEAQRNLLPGGSATGADAVERAKQLDAMRRTDSLGSLGSLDQAAAGSELARQDINGKTFVKKGGWWIDTTFVADQHPAATRVTIEAMSPAYFELARTRPAIARYFSAGVPAVIVFEGTAYVIEPAKPAPSGQADPGGKPIDPFGDWITERYDWRATEQHAASANLMLMREMIGIR